jgi:hypothetical protein
VGKLESAAAEALLGLLPADGSSIGNAALRKSLEQALGQTIGVDTTVLRGTRSSARSPRSRHHPFR